MKIKASIGILLYYYFVYLTESMIEVLAMLFCYYVNKT